MESKPNGRHARRKISRTSLVGALVGLLTISTQISPLAASEAVLEGPEVIHYTNSDTLLNASTSVIQGQRTGDGGCVFTGVDTVSLSEGEDRVTLRTQELAYDPSTCRSLIETGVPAALPPLNESTEESRSIQDSASASTPTGFGILTHATYRAFQRLWYEEPAQQSVGEITNVAQWTPDDTCASPTGGQDEITTTVDHLEQTGWRQISHEWNVSDPAIAFTCERVLSDARAHFKNMIFCITVDTDVFYDTNRVEGLPGTPGTARFTWSARKFGGCSALLAFKRDTDVVRIN